MDAESNDNTRELRCWNCLRTGMIMRSRRTGTTYCAACGVVLDDKSAATDLGGQETGPQRNDEDPDPSS
jgi:transcription initiation factor TFIIIB Brf1 subunit/transcription initiation factor TFIIB